MLEKCESMPGPALHVRGLEWPPRDWDGARELHPTFQVFGRWNGAVRMHIPLCHDIPGVEGVLRMSRANAP